LAKPNGASHREKFSVGWQVFAKAKDRDAVW
jgi:hypothetical protein